MDVRFNKDTILMLAEYPGEQVIVNGKVWAFDYSDRFGPLWLKKDGTERKSQNPNKAVWKAFEQWQAALNSNKK
jgi:hypothetical protein